MADAPTMAQLDALMRTISDMKAVPLAKVMRNAAKDMAFEMLRNTPQAKVTRSPFWKFTKNGHSWWVNKEKIPYVANPGTRSFRQYQKEAKIYRKVSKGYATASWGTMLAQLGGRMTTRFPSAAKMSKAEARAADGEPKPFVRMVNALSYIGKLDATGRITAPAIAKARENIMRGIAGHMAAAMRRASA